MTTFSLPDLGEGLQEAEIVAWEVKEGDQVTVGQPLLSVETDKAVVEIPSPETGQIKKLHAKPGDVIAVGAALVDFEGGGETRGQGIVGQLKEERRAPVQAPERGAGASAKASPAIRALARRLGVDLANVQASGPNGSITTADVERAAGAPATSGAPVAPAAPAVPAAPASAPGIIPLRGVRRAMAQRMAQTHAEIVPATMIEDADVEAWPKGEDVTIRLVHAIVDACAGEPGLNAWFDGAKGEITRHDKIDLGMAVDTPDGLFVPVLRNVGKRDDADLRRGLEAIKGFIRSRNIPPEEMRGATITLSNFGSIGGRYAAPVVVAPQVAIVSAGRIRKEVVAAGDVPAVHAILPLSLTFDHRVVTGGEAARFLRALVASLEKPQAA